jgi:hypothetical protein
MKRTVKNSAIEVEMKAKEAGFVVRYIRGEGWQVVGVLPGYSFKQYKITQVFFAYILRGIVKYNCWKAEKIN